MAAGVLLLAGAVLGGGCRPEAPYRPYGHGVGYDHVRLRPGELHVLYGGPSGMSFAQAAELAKVRAAELALREGATHFRVLAVSRQVNAVGAVRPGVPEPSVGLPGGGFGGGFGDGGFPARYQVTEHPTVVLRVEPLAGPAEGALDARRVVAEARFAHPDAFPPPDGRR